MGQTSRKMTTAAHSGLLWSSWKGEEKKEKEKGFYSKELTDLEMVLESILPNTLHLRG